MFNKSKPKTVNNFQARQHSSMKDEKQSTRKTIQPAFVSDGPQGSSNQRNQYFSFTLKTMADQSDPTVAWSYNVPILIPNQKSLFLATQGFTTVVQDYVGDDFPQTISISLDGVSGFINFSGSSTTKVIVLTLADINTTNVDGMITRDLIYKNDISAFWFLGNRNLKMRVYVDESQDPIAFPIQNQIAISFKIIHLTI